MIGQSDGAAGSIPAAAAVTATASGDSSAWLLRCICDETRFSMLEVMLQDRRGVSVGGLASSLGRDQPLISHHLRRLRECGIVTSRQDGKRTMYRISSPRLADLIAEIAEAGREIPNLCAGAPGACSSRDDDDYNGNDGGGVGGNRGGGSSSGPGRCDC
ncbi:MAG: helix-turn-helix transcriptional regulator [Nitrosopumilaceae archaeon]|nr:helix-turn-helix transcriptional regulator [Nitrosopumilaceae archaeon]